MFRFVGRLTIEFEYQFGMARLQNIGSNILMTGNASVRARVKIPEIVHAGADAGRISPIRASVSAQPRFGRAVTTFA